MSDYFQSEEHFDKLHSFITREHEIMSKTLAEDGLESSLTYSIAVLMAHSTILSSIGLKEIAVKILKEALQAARKGTA